MIVILIRNDIARQSISAVQYRFLSK